MRIEVILHIRPRLAKAPRWDADKERFYFIDSLGERVTRAANSGTSCRPGTFRARRARLAPRGRGGLLVPVQARFFPLAGSELAAHADREPSLPATRPNNAEVDAVGRFLCVSMDMCGPSALWRLDPHSSVSKLDEGIMCSDGPCWSPIVRTPHFAENFRRTTLPLTRCREECATNRSNFVKVNGHRAGRRTATETASSANVFEGRVFRYALTGRLKCRVHKIASVVLGGRPSTGFRYLDGRTPLPKIIRAAARRGLDLRDRRARVVANRIWRPVF